MISNPLPYVSEALELPEPDTSWLPVPWPRSKFSGWVFGA